jgi:signal peptidase I
MTTASSDPIEGDPDVDAAKARPKGSAGEMFELGKTVVYALLIALVLRVFLFQPFTIPSASMEPTLVEGDYIIVSKFAYGWSKNSIPFSPPIFHGRIFQRGPHRGDIVVFKLPRDGHTDYIKRLVGLPGDRIQVKHGRLNINGEPVNDVKLEAGAEDSAFGVSRQIDRYKETLGDKTFITNSFGPDGPADNTGVYVVPKGCYFMMGDNRDNSLDSRFPPYNVAGSYTDKTCPWDNSLDQYVGQPYAGPGFVPDNAGVGFVPAENLVGKADVILFSWKQGASLFKPWTWFTDARWDRFTHFLT